MSPHVCPWWGGYFIDNRLRRLIHKPEEILAPYVQTGQTTLDFGCGMGMFAIVMARLVGPDGCVIAVDLQQKMLDVLHKRAAAAGVAARIRTHRCAANSLDLDTRLDTQVDFALAFYSAHEVPDPQRLLHDLRASLRQGGKLLVVEPVGHVTATDFQTFLARADEVGFAQCAAPPIRWSHTAVLLRT
jgi:ubiquinone/menaquinone biosynthesis C-methylase UbiE